MGQRAGGLVCEQADVSAGRLMGLRAGGFVCKQADGSAGRIGLRAGE